MNLNYSDAVWGEDDSADNAEMCGDERDLIAEVLAEFVPSEILEVGCGSGRLTQALACAYPGLVAIDVSPRATERCRARFAAAGSAPPQIFDCDVREFDGAHRFGAVLALENLVGMDLRPTTRAALIRACVTCLAPYGVCVFGFRVRESLDEGTVLLQAMPYPDNDMATASGAGVAVNWSRAAAESEVAAALGARRFRWRAGDARPAGGRMDFLLVDRGGRD